MITQRLHADTGSPWSVLQGLLQFWPCGETVTYRWYSFVQCCGKKAILFLGAGRAVCSCGAGGGAWVQQMLGCSRCWEWVRVPSPPQSQTRAARILCLVLLQAIIFPALFFKYFPVLKSAVCAPKKRKNGKCSALLILRVSCCPTEWGLEIKDTPVTSSLGSFPGYSHPP